MPFVSQKLAGIDAVISVLPPKGTSWEVPHTVGIALSVDDALISEAMAGWQGRAFIRPCPRIPNHGGLVGGLESHPVDADKAAEETLKAVRSLRQNPGPAEADLIVMSYIDARCSAVGAPGKYIVIGRGHDGVTSGKGLSLTFPVIKEPAPWMDNVPGAPNLEVELVWDGKNRPYFVQARAAAEHTSIGAQPPGTVSGFVPGGQRHVTEKYVVKDLSDLGELEALKGKDPNHLLVIQPEGSMLSHAAAHCRGAGIAFVVADPAKFAKIKWITEVSPGWVKPGKTAVEFKYDPGAWITQFNDGLHEGMQKWSDRGVQLGTFFHQFASVPMNPGDITARLAGGYIGWIIMAGFAALLGEARHLHNQNPGQDLLRRTEYILRKTVHTDYHPSDRSYIYERLRKVWFPVDIIGLISKWLGENTFSKAHWSSSYGGKNWAQCAGKLARVCDAIGTGNMASVIEAVNELEHAAHNNGWMFNKFVSEEYFDDATNGYQLNHPQRVFEAAAFVFDWLDEKPSREYDSMSWASGFFDPSFVPPECDVEKNSSSDDSEDDDDSDDSNSNSSNGPKDISYSFLVGEPKDEEEDEEDEEE